MTVIIVKGVEHTAMNWTSMKFQCTYQEKFKNDSKMAACVVVYCQSYVCMFTG